MTRVIYTVWAGRHTVDSGAEILPPPNTKGDSTMRGTYGLQTRVTNDTARQEWDYWAGRVRKQLALIRALIDEADKRIDGAVIPSKERSYLRREASYSVMTVDSYLDEAVRESNRVLANVKTGIANAK